MKFDKLTVSDAKDLSPVGGLPQDSNKKSIEVLNDILANEYTLFTKTLNFHWNVTGPRFQSLHKLLEEQYHSLLAVMDDVAERIRVLGGRPLSTVGEMEKESSLEEEPWVYPAADEMVGELFRDNLQIQNQIKNCLNNNESLRSDPGTEDFLVGILRKHEMTSWILKSHLN